MLLKSLILAGTTQGLFLMLLLKSKGKNSDADYLLMSWLGIMALQLLFYYDNLSAHPLAPAYIQLLGYSLPLLNSPALYLYIHSLSFDRKFRWHKICLHLIPYLLYNVITFYFCLVHPASITVSYGYPHFNEAVSTVIEWILTFMLAFVPGYYTIASLFVLIKYQKLLPDNYSSTEKINLNWLKWIVISLLLLFAGLFLIIRYGVSYGWVTDYNLFAIVGSILSFYVFFIGYFGLKQTTIFTNIPITATNLLKAPVSKQESYKNSGLTHEMTGQLFQKLKLHMSENKPYLEEDLSLNILASQLNITTNQLSQVINQSSSSNFFNFINNYRVETAKEKLKDPAFAHYSILAIGFDSGFKSKSSFNKIFKDTTGKTPSDYQNQ